ncbi:hypothetical protein F383_17018 [Gossypium arboreum]|uniref:Uncharacterized protein n=1 Tax=Gossypium arboreum TaxID=29729 RepID=A0A0B0MHJ3_GOSAR|nr:hypothetical protein F383_37470 [Gossypium arboreum]KHG14361.1 hypothetical protein F383_17018 [Gossypium arboreum]
MRYIIGGVQHEDFPGGHPS